MHSAFNLFVFPNSMFTPLLLLFFSYERVMSSPEKLHLKITIIIIIINAQKSQHWFPFTTYENYDTLECPAVNDGRSVLATFLTVLHRVEGLETETLRHDLMQ